VFAGSATESDVEPLGDSRLQIIYPSERIRRLSKEGSWILLGQAAALAGSLVGVRLLTELLEPAAYGELALGMTIATLVNQVLFGPLSNGITRYYSPAFEAADVGGYLSAARRLVLQASSAIALAIPVTAIGLSMANQVEWIPLAISVLIFAVLSGSNSILSGIQTAARQRAVVALHQGIEPWARFLLAAALLLWLGPTSTIALIGYAIAIAIVLGSQYLFFRRTIGTGAREPRTMNSEWRRLIWRFSWPFSLFGLFTWLQLASDRWAIGLFATTREVGMYAVLFQLGYYPMSLLTGMLMQLAAPVFYQRAGDARDINRNAHVESLTWRITLGVLAGTCAAVVVALLVHVQVFHVFAASEYGAVSYLFPWMLLSGGVFAAGQTVALNLMSQMKPDAMIWAKTVTAVLGVAMNFAGAYLYGITGIVIASVAFSISYFAWISVLFVRGRQATIVNGS
jgi:O-antigen/teichoic acid export membrane protein